MSMASRRRPERKRAAAVCLQGEPVPLHRALLGADSPESYEPGSDAAANLQAAEVLMQQVCVKSG